MEEKGSLYVKIVDYKTGKKALSLSDLYYGLQMQLMIYLKATVEETQEKTKTAVFPDPAAAATKIFRSRRSMTNCWSFVHFVSAILFFTTFL